MLLSDYNYPLPKSSIAQHPPSVRGNAKLLVLNRYSGAIENKQYTNILEYLQPGDVIVLNDTKVIKARLFAQDNAGRTHELILLEKHGEQENKNIHNVLYRGKLEISQKLYIDNETMEIMTLHEGGIASIKSSANIEKLAEKFGHIPLPPYMKRNADKNDTLRYQTEFAQSKGSVAAPTASLNMTKELIGMMKAKGIRVCYLTLHVGLGTFLPIRSDTIEEHTMHSEWYSIPLETCTAIRDAKQNGNKVIAIGTTVARTLEYCRNDIIDANNPLVGEADIFIYPGYSFKLVDQLLTNFHAPKSTVLMLVAAFSGWPNLEKAYTYALAHDYKFLSYGDSMFIH